MRKRYSSKVVADLLLTLLVVFGTAALAWAGLAGTRRLTAPALPAGAVPSAPDNAFVVVIDAGHGGFDGGAVGSDSGVAEAGLNLDVAKRLANELTARGLYVIMTRTDETALGPTKRADMDARREIMQMDCVDLVVSIHMNKFGDRSVSGPMVFYMQGSEEGEALASCVIGSLCRALERPVRSPNPEELFVLREPKAPSVLVECGFLSNPGDEKKLLTEEHRTALARAIADGIAEYVTGNAP